jgi:ribosomal protein L7Ae-like RNA K-turn-binding protein
MPQNEKAAAVLRFLGLAARARRTVGGIELIATALSRGAKGKTPLVILEASDSSPNTHKRISDRAAHYGVPLYRLPVDGARLALSVGKRDGILMAVGVTEPHIASAITALLEQDN